MKKLSKELENRIRELYLQLYYIHEIVQLTSVSEHYINIAIKDLKAKKADRVNHDEIIKDYKEIKSMAAVGKKFGISEGLVKNILIKHEIPLGRRPSDDANLTTKVIDLLNRGERKVSHIANILGICPSTVSIILKKNNLKTEDYLEKDILDAFAKYKTITGVAKELCMGEDKISKVIDKHKVERKKLKRISVGDKFGMLTVIEFNKTKNRKGCICKCECGNIVHLTRTNKLNSTKKRKKDCGCVYQKKLERIQINREKNKEIKLENERQRIALKNKKIEERERNKEIKLENERQRIAIKLENERQRIALKNKKIEERERRKYRRKWYDRWKSMVTRCTKPNSPRYADYGGRGIKVCERWLEPNGEGGRNYIEDIHKILGPQPGEGYSLDRIDNDGNYEISNLRWATLSTQAKNKRRYCSKSD